MLSHPLSCARSLHQLLYHLYLSPAPSFLRRRNVSRPFLVIREGTDYKVPLLFTKLFLGPIFDALSSFLLLFLAPLIQSLALLVSFILPASRIFLSTPLFLLHLRAWTPWFDSICLFLPGEREVSMEHLQPGMVPGCLAAHVIRPWMCLNKGDLPNNPTFNEK